MATLFFQLLRFKIYRFHWIYFFFFEHSPCNSLFIHNLGSSPSKIWNWSAYMEGKKRPKNEAGHLRLVGGSLNKQGNLLLSLSWLSSFQHLSTRISKCYVKALMGFSHVHSPNGLNNTLLSQRVSFKWLRLWEWWAEHTLQGQGSG